MSKLNRLIGMAAKALDKHQNPAPQQGGGDWRAMVRKAADAVTGDGRTSATPPPAPRDPRRTGVTPPPSATDAADRAAIARYDYLLQTADPRQIEQMHREAFERLTPAQRAQVEARMRSELPPHEQPASSGAPDLARAATRTEAMRPGFLKSLLSRSGGGGRGAGMLAGAGVGAAGGLLAAVAGGAVVSAVAGPLLAHAGELGVDFDAMGDGLGNLGEQASGLGDHLSNLDIPSLGDFFGR